MSKYALIIDCAFIDGKFLALIQLEFDCQGRIGNIGTTIQNEA